MSKKIKEYIERDAVTGAVGATTWAGFRIAELPAADVVEVKHGKWIKSGQSFVYPHMFRNYSCSVCGYDIEKTKYNYCPWCGAKMEE